MSSAVRLSSSPWISIPRHYSYFDPLTPRKVSFLWCTSVRRHHSRLYWDYPRPPLRSQKPAALLPLYTFRTMTTETIVQQPEEVAGTSHPFKLISDTGLRARSDVPCDHYVIKFTKDMALVHNLVLRGLNAAYSQCLQVTPGTPAARDFLIFNQCVFEMLKSHHDMEEEELFPRLEKALNQPGAMATNVAEHHDFHDGLMRFHDYVFNTAAEDYDGPTLRAIIESFGPLVEKHLHNEIAPLYDLHVLESNILKALWNDVEKNYQPNFDKYRHVPVAMTCADNSFKLDGQVTPFPGLPVFASYIVKFLFGRRFSGAWDFAPSDFAGRPRTRQGSL